ncbi:MAG: hypothetical protein E5W25_27710 [Mesorhizobium sp.]|nr:MAG: hypothetical protein E5W25_27710 [Mesorhizobium sp.]
MADYAMSFEKLGHWLDKREQSATLRRPKASSLSMLDGAVAAVVAGPVSMPSEEWVGFYTVMKLRVLAWSRLLSPNTIEHALLLPILIHSVDDDGRPLRVPPSSLAGRNAWSDIPAVVEAMRQFWMPTRFRAGR